MDDFIDFAYVISFNPHTMWGSNNFYLRYIDEETEVQRV